MKASVLFTFSFLLFPFLQASWYWPFERDSDGKESDQPRLSELMEPATTNIDAAADFAAEGRYKEAQESYRAAIVALDQIERDNPERAATPEFASIRNKRAYVNAALDTLLLAEARENAKAVSVTDTTDLEVRLVLKPWREYLPTHDALTNADRIVSRRLGFVESGLVRDLLAAVTDPELKAVAASNRQEIARAAKDCAVAREKLATAHEEASGAVARLERFSASVTRAGGVRVFDVCKKDARKAISACQSAWPKFGNALDRLGKHLEGLGGVVQIVGAERDFPEIALRYLAKFPTRKAEELRDRAVRDGYPQTCQALLDELNAAGAGVVYRGNLYQLQAAWGGEEENVPIKEDDRGLVTDDGDKRPEVESQLDAYMEKERQNNEKIKRVAKQKKADRASKTAVQKEVEKLLKEDSKSRKARLLLAGEDLRQGDMLAAKEKVAALLDEKPNDGPALNMRAAIEATEGDLKQAERTLDQAIQSNPRDYHAYYNMANVYLQKGNVDGARRYYETGRSFAGPKDAELEKAVMHK